MTARGIVRTINPGNFTPECQDALKEIKLLLAIEKRCRYEGYPTLNHTVFKYAGSARLMGKSGGCGT
jgi:hypothetical protein